MKSLAFLPFALMLSIITNAQVTLGYYLPKEISYNPAIPTPNQFFGHEVGDGI